MVPVHYFGAASNTDSALETVFAVLVGRFRNSAIFVAPALPPDSDTQPRAGTQPQGQGTTRYVPVELNTRLVT